MAYISLFAVFRRIFTYDFPDDLLVFAYIYVFVFVFVFVVVFSLYNIVFGMFLIVCCIGWMFTYNFLDALLVPRLQVTYVAISLAQKSSTSFTISLKENILQTALKSREIFVQRNLLFIVFAYSLQWGPIHFAIWTNTFCNLDK